MPLVFLHQLGFDLSDNSLRTPYGDLMRVYQTGLLYDVEFLSSSGESIYPHYLPFGFPMWDGKMFRGLSLEHIYSILPRICPSFKFKTGMRVSDYDTRYTLCGDEVEESNKLDAVDGQGVFCVLDKRFVQLRGIAAP